MSAFLQPISGLSKEAVTLILADYGEELHQLTYNSEYVTIRERLAQVQVERKLEDLRLLAKVAKLTVK